MWDNVFGIGVADGSTDIVERNAIWNTRDFGIAVFGDSDSNRIEKNLVQRTREGDGISLDGDSDSTRIAGNVSSRNGDDGIDTKGLLTTITRNTANDNVDLGIEALPGTDGGGNRASRNGNPLQCVGVSCSR